MSPVKHLYTVTALIRQDSGLRYRSLTQQVLASSAVGAAGAVSRSHPDEEVLPLSVIDLTDGVVAPFADTYIVC